MMMMMEGGRGRGSITSRSLHPFTPSQWQELEIQAIIFNCFSLGLPIPSHLLLSIRRNHFSSECTQPTLGFFPPHSPLGWGCFQLGPRKRAEDSEPGRCRRTDGKKWRCSREAFPDSKYCERHLHRGKNRIKGPPLEFSLHIKGAALKESRHFHGVEEHVVEATSSSGASGLSFQQQNPSFQSPLDRETKLQQHCFVMGADLKLEMPVEFKNGGGQKPNPFNSFFAEREKKDEICKDERNQSSSRQPLHLPSLLDLNV